MPRFSGVQLARAAAIGELRRSSEFLVDGDWQSYQERIAREAEWPEQLPPPDDPRRRLMWGALTRQHKKMLAQLASTSAAITLMPSASQPLLADAPAADPLPQQMPASNDDAACTPAGGTSAASMLGSMHYDGVVAAGSPAQFDSQMDGSMDVDLQMDGSMDGAVASARAFRAAIIEETRTSLKDQLSWKPAWARGPPAATSHVHLPSSKWVGTHAPKLSKLEIGPLMLTPMERHANLQLRGHFDGREGEPLVDEEPVHYTLAPADGESESAEKRREKRHRAREEAAILRLEFEAEDPGAKQRRLDQAAAKLAAKKEEAHTFHRLRTKRARAWEKLINGSLDLSASSDEEDEDREWLEERRERRRSAVQEQCARRQVPKPAPPETLPPTEWIFGERLISAKLTAFSSREVFRLPCGRLPLMDDGWFYPRSETSPAQLCGQTAGQAFNKTLPPSLRGSNEQLAQRFEGEFVPAHVRTLYSTCCRVQETGVHVSVSLMRYGHRYYPPGYAPKGDQVCSLRLSVGHSTAGQIRHNPTHWSEHLPDPVCPRNVCTHPSEITSRHENVADDFIPSRPTRLLPQPFSGVKLTLRVLGSYTSVSMTQPGPGQQSYSSSTYQSTARQWGPGGQCRGRLRGACIHGCNGADCKYFLPFVLSYDCTPCSWRSCNCKQAQASIGDC